MPPFPLPDKTMDLLIHGLAVVEPVLTFHRHGKVELDVIGIGLIFGLDFAVGLDPFVGVIPEEALVGLLVIDPFFLFSRHYCRYISLNPYE